MSGSSDDMRQPQPSTLSQNHPDHPKLADLGLKESGKWFLLGVPHDKFPAIIASEIASCPVEPYVLEV